MSTITGARKPGRPKGSRKPLIVPSLAPLVDFAREERLERRDLREKLFARQRRLEMRQVYIDGVRRTSMRLCEPHWTVLGRIAAAHDTTICGVVTAIDRLRGGAERTAAVRAYVRAWAVANDAV